MRMYGYYPKLWGQKEFFSEIPLLKGQGWPEEPDYGQKFCTPHPALRATLSLQQRDLIFFLFPHRSKC
jgi:hypothetical protein